MSVSVTISRVDYNKDHRIKVEFLNTAKTVYINANMKLEDAVIEMENDLLVAMEDMLQ